jgi:phi LC3 family holin
MGGVNMINWKVRIRNKMFWLALIPAVLLLIQSVAALFGYQLDIEDVNHKMLAVVECLFTVLSILGIVVDPTTAGINDSKRAMTYETPHED